MSDSVSTSSTLEPATQPTHATERVLATRAVGMPSVFEFTDYREFLARFIDEKRLRNPGYSMSAFVQRAGLRASSRGYLRLVIAGKRDLTPHTIVGFARALGLSADEGAYFENLVYFNQAKTPQAKIDYLRRLSACSAKGSAGKGAGGQAELLESQVQYLSNWYLVAIRELVGLPGFSEDPAWITAALRNRVGRREAREAIQHLLRLGLIRRDEASGRLELSEPNVKISTGRLGPVVQLFHLQMLEQARQALTDLPYPERHASGVTLSVRKELLPEVVREIDAFRDRLMKLFSRNTGEEDTVLQICLQAFPLTQAPNPTERKPNEENAR